MKKIIPILMAAALSVGFYGCGETEPNPLAALDITSSQTGSGQTVEATETGSTTTQSGQPIVANAILPQSDLSKSAVLAVSIGHDAGVVSRKGGLVPQNHDPNENPHETKSVSMIITDVSLVTAILDTEQNPQWNVTQDATTGDVTAATLQKVATSSDIVLLQNGTARETVFGCGALTFPDATLPTPSLTCGFNNILQAVQIPLQDAVTRADQSKRYNGVLIKYQKGSIDIVDNYIGLVSQDCTGKTSCSPVAEVTMPIQLAPNANPADNPNSSLDNYMQADVGQLFLPITQPQIFANAVYKLRIDPFSQLGAIRTAAFNPGLGTDRWQVVISGSAAFESLPPGTEITLGQKTEGGTVIQINNPFVAVGSTVDESGQNSALPNPDPSTYWFQATQQQDQVGTVGQPVRVCTTDDCTSTGIDASSATVLKPSGATSICNGALIDKIACQSRSVDGAFSGTPQVITGNMVLLTSPNPDFSGLLGFGTLAFKTPTSIQITETAQAGAQPPQ